MGIIRRWVVPTCPMQAEWMSGKIIDTKAETGRNMAERDLFSCSVMSEPLWPHGLQHRRFPVLRHLQEITQTHVYWVSDAIQASRPLPCPFPLACSLSQHQGVFQWVGSSHQIAKALAFQLQHRPSNELVWSPCCPRDSQESFPAPQLESINSSALSLLYDPALTSIRDYWENHSFDYMEVCQRSDASAF